MASAAVRADSPESACCGYQFGYQRCRRRTISAADLPAHRGPLTRWFMSRPGSVATDASGRSASRPPDLRAMSDREPALPPSRDWHDASMPAPEIRYSDGSVRQGELLSPSVTPALGLDGADLTFIRINYQARLQFAETEVVIESPFRVSVGGEQRTLDPEVRADLGLLLAIYPATLASAVIQPDLSLRMVFESGSTIEVPQDLHYEAWQIEGPGSRLIVCPPEGDGTLAVWR